ncbi:MAG: hypothetical protein R3E65_05980 [Steroidobacteraceae bacterium]
MNIEARSVRSGFLRSAQRFPDRPALQIGAEAQTYAALHDRAASIAATLDALAPAGEGRLTAVSPRARRRPTPASSRRCSAATATSR